MARPIWSGSVSFGLVSIPVKLFSAVSRKSVRFNQIEAETGARIRQKRVSEATGEEVEYANIVKGYELPTGEYVTVTPEELDALDPASAKTIDLEEFVDLADIDPVFYDAAYYLAPSAETRKPYKLLVTAMEESGKVGIARFVMRSKQYVAALRPADGRLLLSTMVYADEVVAPSAVELFEGLDDIEVTERELDMARQLITNLEAEFAPEKFTDTYREAVLELIDRKATGEDVLLPAPAEDEIGSVVDLMAALEASVAEAKTARSRHPTAKHDTDGTAAKKTASKKTGTKKAATAKKAAPKKAGQKKAPAKKTAAKKTAAKKTAKKAPAKKAVKKAS